MKLLRRKQCLQPTLAGWLLILLLLGGVGVLVLTRIHGFLSPNHPVGGDMLVIEGWLDDAELLNAIDKQGGRYRFIVTTGGPLARGGFLSEYKTYAQLSLATLQKIGVNIPLYAVPSPEVSKDRTYASAVALKHWLTEHHPDIHSFDLLTVGPHARRSHLLFCKAFGSGFNIGIIAQAPAYDASRWWTSSAGVRTVIGETIAWVYAALFFSPADAAA